MISDNRDIRERREKGRVTAVSLVAAVCLTVAKLVAGLFTGSLALIAEAVHSGLDTVASIITFFSVRAAGRPADDNHPYGHGRIENLSAVVQATLLLGTAGWIFYESMRRLFFASVEVEPTLWAFAVMGTSIAVDLWRSRMLGRAAARYDSRALEADALNFRADMLSSAVVIAGLTLVVIGEEIGGSGGGLLLRADTLAALVVGVFIVWRSGSLALRSVNVLLDLAPVDLQERISRRAERVPGVVGTRSVRLRESGNRKFADIVISVPRTVSIEEAHEITERVEAAVSDIDSRTESVIHAEPVSTETETAAETVRAIALRMGLRTHHERVQRTGDRLEASLHLEVDAGLTLGEAHGRARQLAAEVRSQNPAITRINTHIEVAEPDLSDREEVTDGNRDLAARVSRIAKEAGSHAHEVRLYRSSGSLESGGKGGIDAVLHCDFPPSANIGEVHLMTEQIEQALRNRFRELEHIVVHAEPAESPP